MTRARICVSVCARTVAESVQLVEDARPSAQLFELRLDCLDPQELDAMLRLIDAETSGRGASLLNGETSFIFTFRPLEQGGARALTTDERYALWRRLIPALRSSPREAFADIELDLLEGAGASFITDSLTRDNVSEGRDGLQLICSRHDFEGVPENLEDIYERMTRTPASLFKIALTAHSVSDCIPVFRLLERAGREGRALIAVAMGGAGVLTRILGPSRGSYLTYGSPQRERATAPGQLTAEELRRLYRVEKIDAETFVTGLVGSPVAHSLSPHMHNAAFAARALNGVYIPFEVGDAAEFVRRIVHPRTREFAWNLRGLSVTAPHKTGVLKHLDWVEPKASQIGAVNTLAVEDDALHGYNTDAEAALKPLQDLIELRGVRVGVIGAGGAARALLWGLRERGAHATVFARNAERARAAAKDFDARTASIEDARFDKFEVVVNATPLGTRGAREQETPASAAQLRGVRVVYDLVYNPSETRLMREARAAGCEVVGGLPMLVAQAAGQFKLWTGLDAPVDSMREAAETRLASAV
ncbi:MAG TPA: shikimate dehydrogenase [Pyrinomonadaceae bacterium]|nr:shikimate dehydrogenase [Pyrinomonadaceae bacterium]